MPKALENKTPLTHAEINILYDNYGALANFEYGWGFSVHIHTPNCTILFDTGENGPALLANMRRASLPVTDVDMLVLSHDHWDHIDGVEAILSSRAGGLKTYLPKALSPFTKSNIDKFDGDISEIDEDWQPLAPGIWSTGQFPGEVEEQALVIDTERGPIVICGCAHPGVDIIARRVTERFPQPILLIAGGFHLKDSDDERIRQTISRLKEYGVRHVAPSHCTGERALALFGEHMPRVHALGAGASIDTRLLD